MKIQELKKQLAEGNLRKIYYLTGKETFVIDTYVDRIIKLANAPVIKTDSLKNVFLTIKSKSLISNKNIYIIRDDKDYLQQETLWSLLNSESVQQDNIVIFIYTKVELTSKFTKECQDYITVFPLMTEDVIATNLKSTFGSDIEDGKYLASIRGNDYRYCVLDMHKVYHLAQATGISMIDAFEQCLQTNLIRVQDEVEVPAFIDSVCSRNITDTYILLNILKGSNISPLAVLPSLYSAIRAILLIQSSNLKNDNDIAKKTGLNYFLIKSYKKHINYYTNSELVKALRLIRETDKDIKNGGIHQDIALDYVVTNIV